MNKPTPEPSRFLHDLTSEQRRRLELVQAGLPVPESLLAPKGVGGKKSYPQLPAPPKLRTRREEDPRRVHREDPEYDCFAMCKSFWQWPVGRVLLRHTQDWDKVTCRKCLAKRPTPRPMMAVNLLHK